MSPTDPSPPILGLDVGGTKTAVCVATREADLLHRSEFASAPTRGFEPMFDELCRHVDEALRRHPEADRIGVSIGGPMDREEGVILSPPHLPGWDRIALRALLEERFERTTYVEHDAKAGALAEWRFGAGRGVSNLIFLTLGTGIGTGIVADGRLLTGRDGMAGEAGHWRMAEDGPVAFGKAGSWEAFASGAGLALLARYRYPDGFAPGTTARDVNDQARDGSEEARAVILESARHLGRGLALLTDLLSPEVIALGSLASRLGQDYLDAARFEMRREILPVHADCRVVPAELGDRIGDVAAIAAVLYREEA